jgi:hypothetical protein
MNVPVSRLNVLKFSRLQRFERVFWMDGTRDACRTFLVKLWKIEKKVRNITLWRLLEGGLCGSENYGIFSVPCPRHCAKSRKIAGSIPDGAIGIFHWHNPSGRTMTLELTQPLTEMSTRYNSWSVKASGVYGWQTYHFHVPIVLKPGSFNLLELSGLVKGCNGIALSLPFTVPESGEGEIFGSQPSTPTLRHSQPRMEWATSLFPGRKSAGMYNDHTSHLMPRLKKE